ncbi:MAG: bifunctional DNA primase/polymerase, partial [Patescibacteria group bacterium]|nr:bifunctional DNA primase/polymerase [Patescibacteria group bacterium]
MTKAEAIRAFLKAGYTLIPLRGKIPIDKEWQKTPYGKYGEAELNIHRNYGVLLSDKDLVVDVDPRSFRPNDNPLERLVAELGRPLSTFCVTTGGGGIHLYFRRAVSARVVNSLQAFAGIEFKSAGRQVVGPGSLHPSGRVYQVAQGTPESVAQIPQALEDLIHANDYDAGDSWNLGLEEAVEHDEAAERRYTQYLQTCPVAVEGQHGDETTYKVACVGRDFGLSAERAWELLAREWNPRCQPPWDGAALRAKVSHAYKYAKRPLGSAHPRALFGSSSADADASPKEEPEISWKLNGKKEIVPCLENTLNFFT